MTYIVLDGENTKILCSLLEMQMLYFSSKSYNFGQKFALSSMTTAQLYEYFLKHPNITTDSRNVPEDSLFFALKGERFDGNKYASGALEKGAAYAVIDNADYQEDARYLLVEDVLTSLQHLATHHRRQFSIPVIGITGSNGKTTTKELISSVLSSHYPTHFTAGNFNNHIGVPLTLLRMQKETEIAVIEMGANHVGEIAVLSAIAEPTHGLITNIGKAHIGEFGGVEGIKKGKSELYKFLRETKGWIFLNEDERFLMELAEDGKILAYGSTKELSRAQAFHTQLHSSQPFVQCSFLSEEGKPIRVQSNLVGEYNFRNICTALAIGRYFKVPDLKIKDAIETYVPSNNRSQIIERDSNTYLLDAYNANPTSMRNALEYFAIVEANKSVAILGDMLELGEYSLKEHQAIIQLAHNLGIDEIILVGTEFSAAKSNLPHFEDVDALKAWFATQNYMNTHFLIKGSRAIRLERILE